MRDYGRVCSINRVLLVEPDVDTREMYVDFFAWRGVGVAGVPGAVEAVRAACIRMPEAVITCLRMPKVDGFELCDALPGTTRTARIPVIALSSCLPGHDRALGDRRFAAVLLKPCLPDVLLRTLRIVLATGHPRAIPLRFPYDRVLPSMNGTYPSVRFR